MTKIGYVRVSDDEQNEDLQIDALVGAGCTRLYADHGVSGAVRDREGLIEMMGCLERGDTLVVWKLDRLGRSTAHLLALRDELVERGVGFLSVTQGIDIGNAAGRMFYAIIAAVGEFELDLNRERTKAGMAAAKRRGVHTGRPRHLTEPQIAEARRMITLGVENLASMAKAFGVSVKTLARALA